MEEIEIGEVGIDKIGDQAREHAQEKVQRAGWMRWLALSTVVFAVLAAIASLESGKLANDSLLRMNELQIRAANACADDVDSNHLIGINLRKSAALLFLHAL